MKLNVREKEILLRSYFLSELTSATALKIVDHVTVASHEARDPIFKQGEKADYFYTVLTGFVRVFRLSKDGREADIGIYGPGETFAEGVMFNGGTHRFCAQSAEAVTLARYEVDKLKQFASQDPAIGIALMASLSRNLDQALECVADDRLHTAPQRVANFILQNCPENANSARFRLPFQKSLLAGKLGLAPEALSRAFSALKSAGVSVHGRIIEIGDVNALKNF
ncbi:Crp/Fnr family transcriptional regulator [Rhizobium sp. C4]|uniref:Crp/Fnr family transcriptional regulator n=1 Tax=Rhizobium sp. C4 TaxID=1349800 RepID=UPI001E4361AF|nr:Crp/Fnr family transcriptional regulator [Rhizobium sp. C4]MCD2173796.1 Crp/Fnr family transcriptional regulator [Rhizobium sp. C4]